MARILSFFKGSKALDLTQGHPTKLLLRFAFPILISTLVQSLYSTTDVIVIGRFMGSDALAAIGGTAPVIFTILGGVSGLASGASVVTAQIVGTKNRAGVRRSIAASLLIGMAATLVLTAATVPLVSPFLRWTNYPESLLRGGSIYLNWIFGGLFTSILFNTAFAEIRALGDSVTPLLILSFFAVVNAILNVLFVAVFGWGYHGVAFATVLVTFFSGVASLWFGWRRFPEFRVRRKDFHVSWSFFWKHLYTALPIALQFSVTGIGVIILQSAINTLGENAISAISASGRVEWLVSIPHAALGIALATYAAQNTGAGRMDRVRIGARVCIRMLTVWSLLSFALCILCSDAVTVLFYGANPPEELFSLVRTYFWCTCPFYIPLAWIYVYRNTIQGVGRQTVPFIGGVVELAARAGCAYWFLAMWGYAGVCVAGPMAWLATGVLLFIYFHWFLFDRDGNLRHRTPHAV